MDESFQPWEIAAYSLATVGALNWGVKGLTGRDLVGRALGGEERVAPRIVYGLVGAAGVATAYSVYKHAREPSVPTIAASTSPTLLESQPSMPFTPPMAPP